MASNLPCQERLIPHRLFSHDRQAIMQIPARIEMLVLPFAPCMLKQHCKIFGVQHIFAVPRPPNHLTLLICCWSQYTQCMIRRKCSETP